MKDFDNLNGWLFSLENEVQKRDTSMINSNCNIFLLLKIQLFNMETIV